MLDWTLTYILLIIENLGDVSLENNVCVSELHVHPIFYPYVTMLSIMADLFVEIVTSGKWASVCAIIWLHIQRKWLSPSHWELSIRGSPTGGPPACIMRPAAMFVNYVKVMQSHYRTGRPWAFQEVEAPRFQDSRLMKLVRFSALRTGRLRTSAIWYSLLLLGYKPVQHVTVLNTVGNCNTVVSIIILYYNII